MSRGFIAALAGLAITIFAWWSPWAWAAWPSIVAFDTFDKGAFAELSHTGQSIVTVLLIALNVAVWALIARAVLWAGSRFVRRPSG
jgi:hypothetical protein